MDFDALGWGDGREAGLEHGSAGPPCTMISASGADVTRSEALPGARAAAAWGRGWETRRREDSCCLYYAEPGRALEASRMARGVGV